MTPLLARGLVCSLLLGCGGRPVAADGTEGADGAGSTGASAGESGGEPPGPIVEEDHPVCRQECEVRDDCGRGGVSSETNTADNWACHEGVCFYLGCVADEECPTMWLPDHTCIPDDNGIGHCEPPCTTVADCEIVPPRTTFECRDGGCLDLGCRQDVDCAGVQECGEGDCIPYPNPVVCIVEDNHGRCIPTCNDPVECGPLWDESSARDRFTCTDNLCGLNPDIYCTPGEPCDLDEWEPDENPGICRDG